MLMSVKTQVFFFSIRISIKKKMSSSSFIDKMNIWKDTVDKCNSFQFKPLSSVKHGYMEVKHERKYDHTRILILNQDCVDCGYQLEKYNYNPVVLNMADNCFPGGHVQIGSGAQEESIFRRSNYFQTLNLETKFYPLIDCELVYSPFVTVIKNAQGVNLPNYYSLAFIACPAIKKPGLVNGKFTIEDSELFRRKIRNILNTAYKYGHDSVVLGAMGCGAWECPQEEVAKLFQEVLKEYEGMFKIIVFSILEVDRKEYIVQNSNLKNSNYQIFKRIFSKTVKE